MDTKVTIVHINKIAKFLGNWKVVLETLGLESQILEDIESKYHKPEEQRSEALNRWVRKAGPQATYRKIYNALCDLEENEAAEKVKELVGGKVCVYVCVCLGEVCVCVWCQH